MFDFRHGRSNQRLLLDRRRGRKHAGDAVNGGNNHDTSTDPIESCQQTIGDGERTVVTDACKPSVKKLIEEEMSHEQDTKMENAGEPKHCDFGHGDNRRKSRSKKSRTKSCDDIIVVHAAENVGSDCHHTSEHEITNRLDMNNIMEELSRQVHQKRMDCEMHDQFGELETEKSQKGTGFEEKLSEVIKFLVSQKVTDGNVQVADGAIDLLDAIRILSSDEELFMKLLRDPNSLSVRHVLDMPDAEVKEGEVKPLAGSEEHVIKKRRNFFRRRSRSQERNTLNGNELSETSKKIVILKPGTTALQNPETGDSLELPTESHFVIKSNRELSEEVSSHFFFSEIKRKLRHAIGMQQNKTSNGDIFKISSAKQQNAGRSGGVKEFAALNSPTKDRFFVERIARPRTSTSSAKDSEISIESETADFSKKKVSSIYIEARKHLSEMLKNGDQNADCSTRQVLKPLGRILSLPDYCSPPIGSPGGNRENCLVTAQTKLAASEKSTADNENNEASPETIPCIPDNTTNTEVEDQNLNIIVPEKCVEEAFCSTGDQISSKEIVAVAEEIVEEEKMVLDTFPETSTSSITLDDTNVDITEVSDEKQDTHCSNRACEEDEQLSSPLESPPHSLVTMKVEYPDKITDIQERPSPVSVLEPLSEDDISPRSNRSHFDEAAIQPIRIRFEECGSSTANQGNGAKSCVDDKELVSDYIKAALQASSLDWEDLFIKSLSSDQLLDSNLLDEVQFHPNQLCHDQSLLFDCVSEVLMEVCGCSPWVSFAKPITRPIPNMRNIIQDVLHGVYWYLLPLPLLQTLDQIVRKDVAKTGTWLDLRVDTETIGVEIGEAIFEDLIQDIITSCKTSNPKGETIN